MADNVPSYVPRSPDLSGLKHEPGGALPPLGIPQHTSSSSTYTPPADFAVSQQPFAAQPYQDHGYSISSYSWPQQQEPQSFYAPQQQQQPNSYPLSPSSTNAPQPPAPGQSKPRRGRPPKSGPGAAKDHDWQSAGEKHVFPSNWQDPAAGDIKIQEDEEESQKPPPGEVEDIRVKTKFPVARIKRIVQADEDVGKVAQSTPVAVSKALELFMISLALKSADEARSRSSKRITGIHLKNAVSKDEQFDFLSDVVDRIQDGPGASKDKEGAARDHSDDMDEDDAAEVKVKKGRGAGRKRRKVEEDEDF